jgi:hypothetical protein
MPVVINDFEVVAETTPGGGGDSRSASPEQQGEGHGGAGAAGPTPNDLRRVLRREMERMERVRAD